MFIHYITGNLGNLNIKVTRVDGSNSKGNITYEKLLR